MLVSDSSSFPQRQHSVGVSVPGDFLVHLPLGPDSHWSERFGAQGLCQFFWPIMSLTQLDEQTSKFVLYNESQHVCFLLGNKDKY